MAPLEKKGREGGTKDDSQTPKPTQIKRFSSTNFLFEDCDYTPLNIKFFLNI